MEVGILSMRYAKAMIEYAQEKGVEDRVYQEFQMLSYSFCAQPGLREALDHNEGEIGTGLYGCRW